MAINLLSLLQAAPGVQAPEEEEILVQSRPQGGAPSGAGTPRPMGNRSYIEEAREALGNAPQHKGLFGTRGTLRDVLGTIGDAFLIQSGNKTMYAPRREQERMSDALSGFTDDPIAAIERLSQVNPEAAQELFVSNQANELRSSQQRSLDEARKSQIDARDFDRFDTGMNRVSRWVRGGMPVSNIIRGASRYGITAEDLQELGVHDNMTPEERAQFAAGDMTVNQQEQIPLRQRQVAVAEKNADSNRIRATKPPAPRAQPQPTAASIAAPLLKKLERGETLTPAQQEVLNRAGYSANRGQGRKRTPPPLPPGFKIK